MKWMINTTVVAIGIAILIILQTLSGSTSSALSQEELIHQMVFTGDDVIDVNISIDQDVYTDMIENALNEETVMADITYNGITLESVGIRPKGNSSLQQVARSGDDRFSFKVDIDEYIDGQNLFGLEKFNLNNIFEDPSMMAEYLSYDMLASIGADAPRTAFVALSINGEYFGLYLAVEQVDENFLIDHYGHADGSLYKPDMGEGSDLSYNDQESYAGITDELGISTDTEALNELMKRLANNEAIDDIFNVDSFLKYLAVSSMVIHYDSYQGGMFHNYYLYDNGGVWEWIGWDFNMTFNGFPMSNMTDEEAVKSYIDEPVLGAMENYPLLETIFANEDYVETYHQYLQTLIDQYLNANDFSEKVLTTMEKINSYVKTDPSKFYDYEAFLEGVTGETGILAFMASRVENVESQLSGELASTNNGNGNASAGGNMKAGNMDRPAPGVEGPPMDGQVNNQRKPGGMNDQANQPGMMLTIDLDTLVKLVGEDDIPKDILTALSNGHEVPQDTMKAFLDSLSEEIRMQLMQGQAPMENQNVDQRVKPQAGPEQDQKDQVLTSTSERDSLIISGSLSLLVLALGYFMMKLKR